MCQSCGPQGHKQLSLGLGCHTHCPSTGEGPAPLVQAGSAPLMPGKPLWEGWDGAHKSTMLMYVSVLQNKVCAERMHQPHGHGGGTMGREPPFASSEGESQQIWVSLLPCSVWQEGCQGNPSPWCLPLIHSSQSHLPSQKDTFPFYCPCCLLAPDLHNSIIGYKHLIPFTLPQ